MTLAERIVLKYDPCTIVCYVDYRLGPVCLQSMLEATWVIWFPHQWKAFAQILINNTTG